MITKKEFEYEKQLEELKHKNKMEQIEAEREAKSSVVRLKHEKGLEFHRIKNADIKRSLMLRGR